MRQWTEVPLVYWGFLYDPLFLFAPGGGVGLFSEEVVRLLAAVFKEMETQRMLKGGLKLGNFFLGHGGGREQLPRMYSRCRN